MKPKYALLFICIITFYSCKKDFSVNQSQAESFIKFYGTPFENSGNSILQINDGGYIIAGETTKIKNKKAGDKDICIIRLDKFGNKKWEKIYGGNGNDEGKCLQSTSDGGFVVCGLLRDSIQTKNYSHLYLLRLNADGDSLWTIHYGAALNSGGNDVIETTDQGFVVAGFIESAVGNKDNLLLKLDANGKEIWNKRNGFNGNDEIQKVVEIATGFVISGYAYNNPANSGIANGFIAKTNSTGNIAVIAPLINDNPIESGSFVVLSDNSFVYLGTMAPLNGGSKTIQFVSIPADLSVLKITSKDIALNGSNSIREVISTSDGFVFTGTDYISNNILIAKCNLSGDVVFSNTYGDAGIQNGNSIVSTTDGGYAIAGVNKYIENGNAMMAVVKTRADGKQ